MDEAVSSSRFCSPPSKNLISVSSGGDDGASSGDGGADFGVGGTRYFVCSACCDGVW